MYREEQLKIIRAAPAFKGFSPLPINAVSRVILNVQIGNHIKERSLVRLQRYKIADPSKFDFVYIKEGKLRFYFVKDQYSGDGNDNTGFEEIGEGQYVDQSRIAELGVRLIKVVCCSGLAKVLIIDNITYENIKGNQMMLAANLHNAIYKIS